MGNVRPPPPLTMLATPTLRFDSVCVLESIEDASTLRRTGKWLVENVLTPVAPQHGIQVFFAAPVDRASFFQSIERIRDVVVGRGHGPIIHVEAHGDKHGLILASRETVEWSELAEALTAINHAVGFNLLLVLAMCRGYYFIQTVVPTRPSPVWALVGPAENVWDYDLRQAMAAFYRELLTSLDGRAAVRALNEHKPPANWEYRFEPADFIFCRVFKTYLETRCTPDQLQDRENDIVAEIMRGTGYDLVAAMAARRGARRMLQDHERLFDHLKREFFMFSDLPRNADRFTVKFSDCGGASNPRLGLAGDRE